ncbi:hypothetical protein AB0G76_36900 [Streptomyces asoensis]|uniref:hypothetical protein n=1 Tax=Streptomyces asoensis TaxID=249586 RepID=UPI0033DB49F9
MNTRITACAALLALAALTGCSSGDAKADPAACKTALEAQYVQAVAEGTPGTDPVFEQLGKPDECAGISDEDLRVYSSGIIGKHSLDNTQDALEDLNDSIDDLVSSIPTPAP